MGLIRELAEFERSAHRVHETRLTNCWKTGAFTGRSISWWPRLTVRSWASRCSIRAIPHGTDAVTMLKTCTSGRRFDRQQIGLRLLEATAEQARRPVRRDSTGRFSTGTPMPSGFMRGSVLRSKETGGIASGISQLPRKVRNRYESHPQLRDAAQTGGGDGDRDPRRR